MQQKSDYVLPSVYLWPVKKICADKYIDLPRLLAKVGLHTTKPLTENVLIDQVAFIEVLKEGAKASGDDLFGFLAGKELSLHNTGFIGQLIACQTCIANMYPIINYLFNAEHRGARHQLVVRGQYALHEILYLVSEEVECDQVAQLTITAYFNTFRELLGNLWRPTRIFFRQDKMRAASILEDYYACPVIFNADMDAIEFPASLIYQHTEKEIDRSRRVKTDLAGILASQDDLDRLVASYIEFNLSDHQFNKASVAKCLGVHPRVLQNCLAEKGFEFKNILEDVRKQNACKLLKKTDLSVAEIATDVGYTESRSFVRAFRQWTGTTPLQWRKSVRG